VKSGTKPAPTSISGAMRPSTFTVPVVGVVIRANIFSRVDLPAPWGDDAQDLPFLYREAHAVEGLEERALRDRPADQPGAGVEQSSPEALQGGRGGTPWSGGRLR